jgi:hypothetical protein
VNQLLLHTLRKEIDTRAMYMKFTKGIEETDRMFVELAKNVFLDQVRDYNQHNVEQFFQSSLFTKDFKLEGDYIKTVREI